MKENSPLGRRAARLFGRNLTLRFVIVGVLNTGFSTLLFMLLLALGFGIAIGSGIALAIGVLFSYYTQGTIVFRYKSVASFLRFIVAWTLIYLANLGEVKLFVSLGSNVYLAGVCATVPTTIVSYFVQKFLVFRTLDGIVEDLSHGGSDVAPGSRLNLTNRRSNSRAE